MAGWLRKVDGSGLESLKSHRKALERDPFLSEEELEEGDRDKLKLLLNENLSVCFKETSGTCCFGTLYSMPMLGNGRYVDLFKLCSNVKDKGGYERVTENGLWGSVAEECGFDAGSGLALKLIHAKYSNALQRASENKGSKGSVNCSSGDNFGGCPMDFQSKLERCLCDSSVKKSKSGKNVKVDLRMSGLDFVCEGKFSDFDNQGDHLRSNGEMEDGDEKGVGEDVLDKTGNFNADDKEFPRLNKKMEGSEKIVGKDVLDKGGIPTFRKGLVSDDGKVSRSDAFGEKVIPVDKKVIPVDKVSHFSASKEDMCSIKRKRECTSEILNWITMVAKDPCNPVIGTLPESHKWKFYPNSLVWKQVLLVRDAMVLRKDVDSNDQPLNRQKKQKMHPSMYDDHSGSEKLRQSQRILSSKECSRKYIVGSTSSSVTQTDDDCENNSSESVADTFYLANVPRRAKVLVGRHFQAKLDEWTGYPYEADTRWIGTRTWPLEKKLKHNSLIEREPVGKGRQDSCGCEIQGSIACVKFHVSEKRDRLKLELGPAFYQWRMNTMGEDATFSWTKAEEKIFHDTVKSNPLSQGFFWDEIVKALPNKGKRSLVSYYYNVFLLRRRGDQNRCTPEDINSDDDEPNAGSESFIPPGSIFCSPKKAKTK